MRELIVLLFSFISAVCLFFGLMFTVAIMFSTDSVEFNREMLSLALQSVSCSALCLLTVGVWGKQ